MNLQMLIELLIISVKGIEDTNFNTLYLRTDCNISAGEVQNRTLSIRKANYFEKVKKIDIVK